MGRFSSLETRFLEFGALVVVFFVAWAIRYWKLGKDKPED